MVLKKKKKEDNIMKKNNFLILNILIFQFFFSFSFYIFHINFIFFLVTFFIIIYNFYQYFYIIIYLILYINLFNIFNFYIFLIFIIILFLFTIKYKKINFFIYKNIISNFLILSINSKNNKFLTLYEKQLNIDPNIIKDLKIKNYVSLEKQYQASNSFLDLNRNKKLYYNFSDYLNEILFINKNSDIKFKHLIKDFENDNFLFRIAPEYLNNTNSSSKENILLKIIEKERFFGERGEKWEDIEIYYNNKTYFSFMGIEDIEDYEEFILKLLKNDLTKDESYYLKFELQDILSTVDEEIDDKLENFEMMTDFKNLDWDSFTGISIFDRITDQSIFTFFIFLGFNYIQYYIFGLIFNKFKIVHFKFKHDFIIYSFLMIIFFYFNLFFYNYFKYKSENLEEIYSVWLFPEWIIYPILYNWWFILITISFIFLIFILFIPENLILRGNNLINFVFDNIYFIILTISLILPLILLENRIPFWEYSFLYDKNINIFSIIFILILLGFLSILFFYIIVIFYFILIFFLKKKKITIIKLYLILFSNFEWNVDLDLKLYTKKEFITKIQYRIVVEHENRLSFFFVWFFLNILFIFLTYYLFYFISYFNVINLLMFIIFFLIFIFFFLFKKYLKINFFFKIKKLIVIFFLIIFLYLFMFIYF